MIARHQELKVKFCIYGTGDGNDASKADEPAQVLLSDKFENVDKELRFGENIRDVFGNKHYSGELFKSSHEMSWPTTS